MVGGADPAVRGRVPGRRVDGRHAGPVGRGDPSARRGAHGPEAVWVAVTHGDIIKSVLADALGMHLDLFQRITVNPGSVSIIRYGTTRPEVVATNTDSGDLSWLRAAGPVGDAVGGGRAPGPPLKVGDMPALVHQFDWPDRVVVGTVGHPGSRTFYLQVRDGARSTSVALEKEQSAVLAEKIDEILDALMADDQNRFSVPADTPAELVDNDPLDQPVEEEFRAGLLRLAWDPSTAQVVVEAFPLEETESDDEEAEPSEMLLVRMPVGTARAFVERTRQVVRSGRPLCPRCGRLF